MANEKCGILFTHSFTTKDTTGCVRDGLDNHDKHLFKDEQGRWVEWEFDYSCDCGCWDEVEHDHTAGCIIYSYLETAPAPDNLSASANN